MLSVGLAVAVLAGAAKCESPASPRMRGRDQDKNTTQACKDIRDHAAAATIQADVQLVGVDLAIKDAVRNYYQLPGDTRTSADYNRMTTACERAGY